MNIGRVLNLVIRASSGGAMSVLAGLGYMLGSLSIAANATKIALIAVGIAVAMIGVKILGFLSNAVTAAGDYDAAMRKILTITETGAAGFEAMKNQVLELSRVVPKSATELGTALYDIKSVITDDATAMKLLAIASKAASLAGTDTKDVARALASALVAYNGTTEDAARWTDQLTAAVSIGRGEFADYAKAMPQLTGFGAMLGITFKELATSLAFLTRRGYTAATGTTYLRNVMLKIMKPTAGSIKVMDQLGISWGKAAVAAKGGLIPYLQDIIAKTGGSEKALAKIFPGLRQLPVLFALAQDPGKDFAKTLDVVANSAGTLEERFAKAMDGFNNKKQILVNAFAELKIRIGNVLLPVITQLVGAITPVVQAIAKWVSANPEILKFVTIMLAASAVVMTVLGAIMAIVGAIMLLSSAMGVSAGVVALVFAGIVAAATGAGGSIAAAFTGEDAKGNISAISKAWTDFKLGLTWGDLPAADMTPIRQLGADFRQALIDIPQAWSEFKAGLTWGVLPAADMTPIRTFGADVGATLDAITQAWKDFTSGLTFQGNAGDIMNPSAFKTAGIVIKSVFDGIKTTFAPVVASLGVAWTELQTKMGPALAQLKLGWDAIKPVVVMVAQLLGVVLAAAISIVVGAINGIILMIAPLIQAFGGVLQFVGGFVMTLVKLFSGDLKGAWESFGTMGMGIYNFFAGVLGAALGFIEGFIEGVVNFFIGLYNTLVGNSIVPDLINGIVSWFKGLPGKVMAFVSSLVTSAVNGFLDLKAKLVNSTLALVKAVSDKVKDFLQIGKDIASGIKKGISDTWSGLVTKLKGLVALLPAAVKKLLGISSPSKAFAALGRTIPQGLAVGIAGATQIAVRAADKMAASLNPTLSPSYGMQTTQVVRHEVVFGDLPAGLSLQMTGREVADLLMQDRKAITDVSRTVNRVVNGEVR
jgi:TP901 family phage tail tape measure protein